MTQLTMGRKKMSIADLSGLHANDKVRVVHAEFMGAMVLDARKDTLAAGLFGRGFSDGWFAAQRSLLLNPLFAVLWLAAHIVPMLALCGVLPKSAVWMSLAGFPALIQLLMFSNRHILRRLATDYEVVYLLLLVIAWAITAADVFFYDERTVYVAFAACSFANTIFVDAQHHNIAKFMAFGLVVGIVVETLLMLFMHFSIFEDLNTRTVALGSMLGLSDDMSMTVNTVMFANRSMLILLAFFIKNLVAYVRHPKCYVLLKARLKREKMSVADIECLLPPGHELSSMPKMSSIHHINLTKSRGWSGKGNAVRPASGAKGAAVMPSLQESEGAQARIAELERQLAGAREENEELRRVMQSA